jgi:hypothetical protein
MLPPVVWETIGFGESDEDRVTWLRFDPNSGTESKVPIMVAAEENVQRIKKMIGMVVTTGLRLKRFPPSVVY